MKKNFSKIIAITVVIFSAVITNIAVLTGCTTTKTEETADPYFIADFNSFNVGEIVCLTKQTLFSPKTCTMGIDFYPRTSSFSASFRDGMNKVLLIFSPEEVKSLTQGVNSYMALRESNGFDKNHKPGRKNMFQKGNVHIYWGATGYGRDVITSYNTNYEYLNDNPYFKLTVKSASYPEEENVGSPLVNIYIAPNQLEKLGEITDMNVIMEEINRLNEAAFSFE